MTPPPSEAPPLKGSTACWSRAVSGSKCLEAYAWCVLVVGQPSPSNHKEFLGQSWTWLKMRSRPAFFVGKWHWDVDLARDHCHRVEHPQKHLGEGASVPSLAFLCRCACSPASSALSPGTLSFVPLVSFCAWVRSGFPDALWGAGVRPDLLFSVLPLQPFPRCLICRSFYRCGYEFFINYKRHIYPLPL